MRFLVTALKRLALLAVVVFAIFLTERFVNRPFVGIYRSAGYVEEPGSFTDVKLIHQSWSDENVPKPELQESWKKMNPNYTYHFMTNSQFGDFVKEKYPDIYPLFKRLPKEIMRVDLFRYILMYDQGGVYSDIDTECIKPIDTWVGDIKQPVKFVLDVEFDASHVKLPYWEEVQMQFVQWTFAAAPKHPLLWHVISTIVNRYKDMPDEELAKVSVHDMCGPTVWSDAVKDYFCQRNFCNWMRFQRLDEPVLINDVLVLPPTSFQPYTMFRGKGKDHRLSFVVHNFLGSWR